jgi:hypothetical protein
MVMACTALMIGKAPMIILRDILSAYRRGYRGLPTYHELAAMVDRSDRRELQAEGKHPVPCARFCESNAYEIELRRLKSKLAEASKDTERLKVRLITFADAEYVRGIRIAQQTETLGWDQKAKTGQFSQKEYDSHKAMNEAFGAHKGIYAAMKGQSE